MSSMQRDNQGENPYCRLSRYNHRPELGSQIGAGNLTMPTEQFLVHFGLASLRDLPDAEQLADAGIGPEDI